MKSKKWLLVCTAGLFALASSFALAQGNGNGHGKDQGKGHGKHGDDDPQAGYYKDHDRDIRSWYGDHQGNLPPGLAKKDQLPPGLEKQLVRRGTLPPGLQKRIQPCPPDLERRLPPPPPESAHVLIGGHIVLLNRKTNVVIDIFNLE
ncbi:MAG: hypothetical protein LAN18_09050 [Acidobacteriia bacterium]|nr:hypothetical protein [Terriglobia bacterium]